MQKAPLLPKEGCQRHPLTGWFWTQSLQLAITCVASQLVLNEPHHQVYLTFGQLASERRHSISAFGDVMVDLTVGLVFKLAVAKIRDLLSIVERLPFALGSMTDRAVLAKQ